MQAKLLTGFEFELTQPVTVPAPARGDFIRYTLTNTDGGYNAGNVAGNAAGHPAGAAAACFDITPPV